MEEIKEVLGCGMVKDWTDEQLKDAFQKNGETMKNCEMILATASAENQVIWYEAIERKIILNSPKKGFDPMGEFNPITHANVDLGVPETNPESPSDCDPALPAAAEGHHDGGENNE